MIRRLLLSTVALVAVTTIATAADLPSRRAPPVYVAPVPVFSWTGPYIGINAGYSFSNDHDFILVGNDGRSRALQPNTVPALFQSKGNGFTGGGQIGYNYELGAAGTGDLIPGFGVGGGGLVIGVEADAAYLDDKTFDSFVAGTNVVTTYRARTNYLGTVRGRLGAAFGPLLVYGTGGFAYGGVSSAVSVRGAAPAYFGAGGNSMRTGYAAGGGVEYAIPTASFLNFLNSSAVTVKVEYLHYQLSDSAIPVNGNGSSFSGRVRNEGNLVRAGLNYKLGFTPAPVVARY